LLLFQTLFLKGTSILIKLILRLYSFIFLLPGSIPIHQNVYILFLFYFWCALFDYFDIKILKRLSCAFRNLNKRLWTLAENFLLNFYKFFVLRIFFDLYLYILGSIRAFIINCIIRIEITLVLLLLLLIRLVILKCWIVRFLSLILNHLFWLCFLCAPFLKLLLCQMILASILSTN